MCDCDDMCVPYKFTNIPTVHHMCSNVSIPSKVCDWLWNTSMFALMCIVILWFKVPIMQPNQTTCGCVIARYDVRSQLHSWAPLTQTIRQCHNTTPIMMLCVVWMWNSMQWMFELWLGIVDLRSNIPDPLHHTCVVVCMWHTYLVYIGVAHTLALELRVVAISQATTHIVLVCVVVCRHYQFTNIQWWCIC